MGQLNFECVRCRVEDYKNIINEKFKLFKDYSKGYVNNENVKQVSRKHENLLCKINGAFSF